LRSHFSAVPYANMPLSPSLAADWFTVEPQHAVIQNLIKSPKLNLASNSQTGGSAETQIFCASGNESDNKHGAIEVVKCSRRARADNSWLSAQREDARGSSSGDHFIGHKHVKVVRLDTSWLSYLCLGSVWDTQPVGHTAPPGSETTAKQRRKDCRCCRCNRRGRWLSDSDMQPRVDCHCCSCNRRRLTDHQTNGNACKTPQVELARKRRHHVRKRLSEAQDSESCVSAEGSAESRSDSIVRCNFRTPASVDWTGGVLGEASIQRAHTAPDDSVTVRLFDLTANDYDDYEADFFPGETPNCRNRPAIRGELGEVIG